MRTSRVTALLCIFFTVLAYARGDSAADVIRFKKGGAQRCVVIEETKETLEFLSPMGVVKVSMEKIGSIERQSDDVNAALEAKWSKKKTRTPKPKPAKPKPAKPRGPQSLRTYRVDITKRAITLGGRKSGVEGGQPVANFLIDDLGVVEGNRLFEVTVTSYRSGSRRISGGAFHALYRNGHRIDSKPLEGFEGLDATLAQYDMTTGYVAFPTNGELETLVVRSKLTDFDLDLESGNFSTKGGSF